MGRVGILRLAASFKILRKTVGLRLGAVVRLAKSEMENTASQFGVAIQDQEVGTFWLPVFNYTIFLLS